ncbi:MAG: TPM domain-containing protein [Alistipes sp.]|nr:TPM domain-containing protein [Alistipes sp.]
MKRFFVVTLALLCYVATALAGRYSVQDIPNVQLRDASRYTSNPDNILSSSAVAAIDRACDSLHSAGKAQIAVVVVEDIDSDDVFSFAHSLFSSWGVGGRESDNGLGILLVTEKREIRFVTGYGLEGILPDALCKRIQQRYMVEHLAAGDYSTGMVEGVAAVANVVSAGGVSELEGEMTDEEFTTFLLSFFGFMVAMIAVAVLLIWLSRKCPKCGKHKLLKISSENILSTRKYDLMEHTYRCGSCGFVRVTREKVYKQTGVYVGGGGRGFGGGSSFGGGFGGGSFGGGGAGSRF